MCRTSTEKEQSTLIANALTAELVIVVHKPGLRGYLFSQPWTSWGSQRMKDVACQEKSWTSEELLQRIVQSADRID